MLKTALNGAGVLLNWSRANTFALAKTKSTLCKNKVFLIRLVQG